MVVYKAPGCSKDCAEKVPEIHALSPGGASMSISWHSHHFPPAPLGHCGEIWASYHIEVPLLYPGYLPAKPNGEGTHHAVPEVLQGTQMAPYALYIDAYIYLMCMGTSLFTDLLRDGLDL